MIMKPSNYSMLNYLITIVFYASLLSCGNSNAEQEKAREQHIIDSTKIATQKEILESLNNAKKEETKEERLMNKAKFDDSLSKAAEAQIASEDDSPIRGLPDCEFVVVVQKAFFYDSDNRIATGNMIKRQGYLAAGDIVWTICKYSDSKYVYVRFKNKKGQLSKGFVLSSDLKQVDM